MNTKAAAGTANRKSKIFVVDDHPIVRQGLGLLINREPDMIVCGAAEEAQSALRAIPGLQPDVLVVDISLSGPDGLELVKTIRTRDANLPILVLSMHDESIYAERALRAGANGYIMKQEATEKVLVAIRRILRGRCLFERSRFEQDAAELRARLEYGAGIAGGGFIGSRAGSFPVGGRGTWDAADCRGIAFERENRGDLSGAY